MRDLLLSFLLILVMVFACMQLARLAGACARHFSPAPAAESAGDPLAHSRAYDRSAFSARRGGLSVLASTSMATTYPPVRFARFSARRLHGRESMMPVFRFSRPAASRGVSFL